MESSTVDRFKAQKSYLLIGAFNTSLDIALFMVFQHLLPIWVATFLASGFSMCFSFWANSRFTFEKAPMTWKSAALFFGTTGTVMWLIQPALIYGILACTDLWWGQQWAFTLGAKVASTGVVIVLNFLLYSKVVFRKREPS